MECVQSFKAGWKINQNDEGIAKVLFLATSEFSFGNRNYVSALMFLVNVGQSDMFSYAGLLNNLCQLSFVNIFMRKLLNLHKYD